MQKSFFFGLIVALTTNQVQESNAQEISALALKLAQSCVAEIDLVGRRADRKKRSDAEESRECHTMWAISKARAQAADIDLSIQLDAYHSALRCAGKRCDTERMQRIRSLDVIGSEPTYWPDTLGDWQDSEYQQRWLRRLSEAQQWIDEGMPDTRKGACKQADQYGGDCAPTGACDAVPACWLRVSCGPMAQAYYVEKSCTKTIAAELARDLSGAQR